MGGVPILRPGQPQPKPPSPDDVMSLSGTLGGLLRHMDENGIAGTFKRGLGHAPREWYMDAEQLLAAIQGLVRHELRAAFRRSGLVMPDEPEGADFLTPCAATGCKSPGVDAIAVGMGQGPDPVAIVLRLCPPHAEEVMRAGEGEEQQYQVLEQQPPTAPLVLG